ncbi:MAG: serine/threonine-protein phosphatase [Acidobacteria bacterium]|jgi:serine phosphatase RsbU (regulator of sigma subunit)|nr:serine/threonine-protein phosphatase [Acidobacteriota bacterium]
MVTTPTEPNIGEYLRKRLMPVEGAIPMLAGIEMYGNSIPAEGVGGDLFEYINFQQRYNIDARIAVALKLAAEYLEPLPKGQVPRNSVDAHVQWLKTRPGYTPAVAAEYRKAKSSEQIRVAEDLQELYTTAGVLLVDAQGHGIISAKIASTVHDTFHALILSELDQNGKTTPEFFEKINLRLAQSVTARNALGRDPNDSSREIATMVYGEIRPSGNFRFVNFGHPPPLVFSAEFGKFMDIGKSRMARFLPLGLEIPEDHPDRNKYFSMRLRKRRMDSSDVSEITLMSRGDILFLYSDGVYDGSDDETRAQIERVMEENKDKSAKEICNAILQFAVARDERFRQEDESDLIDDKTAFIIKRQ